MNEQLIKIPFMKRTDVGLVATTNFYCTNCGFTYEREAWANKHVEKCAVEEVTQND